MLKIFRQLRWKLTLSYTLVTVCAFLVVTLTLVGVFYVKIFVPENVLTPAGLVEVVQKETAPLWSEIIAKYPGNTDLYNLLISGSNTQITKFTLMRIGAVQFSVQTMARFKTLLIAADGTLLARSEPSFLPSIKIGEPFTTSRVPDLEKVLTPALAGETDPDRLNVVRGRGVVPLEPYDDRILLAAPIFKYGEIEPKTVEAVFVVILDEFPTQKDIPRNILQTASRALLVFLFSAGAVGALFGLFFSNGLVKRFKRLSTTTDAWSEGNFSDYITDNRGDEISHLAQRLNNMARQLKSLLQRRQEMAISEERNRLARDLHDSAKQQALAASLELGAGLALYENDPHAARLHLEEADRLVDMVREELTNLVHELRPQAIDGQDFSETLREYAIDWSHRSGIKLNFSINGNDGSSLIIRSTLFRIAQEALANISRHSNASKAELSLRYETDSVTMEIEDDGCGFDVNVENHGYGLHSMQERADEMGGRFAVESKPGEGTRIVVTLPKTV
jgi:two-component system, NarL family, sensor histidine kinase LiaS